MSWSLGEIEALARKAARGAGMSWGLAEEAGKATRWLCASGWPGAEALAGHLQVCDGLPWSEICPAVAADLWQAKSGRLCPLATGASLIDLAHNWADGETAQIGPTSHPILLTPYMAWASGLMDAPLTICWAGVEVIWSKGRLLTSLDSMNALTCPQTDRVTLSRTDRLNGENVTRAYRAEISMAAEKVLSALAQRTYAPETDESKLAGAGAGLRDTD